MLSYIFKIICPKIEQRLIEAGAHLPRLIEKGG